MRYTRKLHAYRLELMLTSGNPCKPEQRCPASKGWVCHPTDTMWLQKHCQSSHPCRICIEFVGGTYEFLKRKCPCMFLDNPVKDSLEAIRKFRKKEAQK
jgi:hypothetical protein